MNSGPPLSRTHLSQGLGDRYAERSVAVQDNSLDMEFSRLVIEVACHENLHQQLHAMHVQSRRGFSDGNRSIFARWLDRGISMREGPHSGQSRRPVLGLVARRDGFAHADQPPRWIHEMNLSSSLFATKPRTTTTVTRSRTASSLQKIISSPQDPLAHPSYINNQS